MRVTNGSATYPVSVSFIRAENKRWQPNCAGTSSGTRFSERGEVEQFVRDWFAHWSERPLPIDEVSNYGPESVIPVVPQTKSTPSVKVKPPTPLPDCQPVGVVVVIVREADGYWRADWRMEGTREYPDSASALRAVRAWVRYWSERDIPIYHVIDRSPLNPYVPVDDSVPGG